MVALATIRGKKLCMCWNLKLKWRHNSRFAQELHSQWLYRRVEKNVSDFIQGDPSRCFLPPPYPLSPNHSLDPFDTLEQSFQMQRVRDLNNKIENRFSVFSS